MSNNLHETVLVKEVIEALQVERGKKYIDATLGNAGHTLEILKKGGNVLGIELDPKMLEIAEKRLKDACQKNFKLVEASFTRIDELTRENDWGEVDGILFDLGVTNLHLKNLERGFSFENPEALLDMRLNPDTEGVKASDLLNALREDQLRTMFETTLEPGPAKWITGRVMHSRDAKPIETVGDFLEICQGLKTRKAGLSEATLPFLAVRITVNSELSNLEEVLPKAFRLLGNGGRLVVISFHSKEDTLVKNFFKEMSQNGGKMITFKPVTAGDEEINLNRRSRSAKMRVLEKQI